MLTVETEKEQHCFKYAQADNAELRSKLYPNTEINMFKEAKYPSPGISTFV